MMNIKKKIMVIFATGIMAFSASPFVLAATPVPANNTQQAEQVDTTQQDTANQNNTANQNTQAQIPAAGNAQTQTDTSTQVSNKKYLSKGWAVFWFIFTIIINAIISFWIGNRFYKLSKKDNHLSFEIRALRKDIEEKFVNNVGGFSEQEVDIKNLNESLALDDEGLKPTAKQPVLNEVSAEEEARFRRWEEAQSKPRKERVKPKSVLKEEFDEELDDVKKIKRKNYQPKRNPSEDFEDEKENEKSESVDMDATREIKLKGEGVKSKAKELLGDIFPFKEDLNKVGKPWLVYCQKDSRRTGFFEKKGAVMDLKDVQPYIEDKVCMVTGGGGSIGSEIVRSLSKLNAEKIVIVDIYENGAYSVKCEVGDKVTVEIASVRDYEKMDCIMNKYRPDIVFHAAAHKHVPFMELSPEEAVKNNVKGTETVANLAEKYNTDNFVLISTDKADAPISVMGAS